VKGKKKIKEGWAKRDKGNRERKARNGARSPKKKKSKKNKKAKERKEEDKKRRKKTTPGMRNDKHRGASRAP